MEKKCDKSGVKFCIAVAISSRTPRARDCVPRTRAIFT